MNGIFSVVYHSMLSIWDSLSSPIVIRLCCELIFIYTRIFRWIFEKLLVVYISFAILSQSLALSLSFSCSLARAHEQKKWTNNHCSGCLLLSTWFSYISIISFRTNVNTWYTQRTQSFFCGLLLFLLSSGLLEFSSILEIRKC